MPSGFSAGRPQGGLVTRGEGARPGRRRSESQRLRGRPPRFCRGEGRGADEHGSHEAKRPVRLPSDVVLPCLLQVAVLSGATRVDVAVDAAGAELLFDGDLPEEDLWSGLQAGCGSREEFRRRQLALGASAALANFAARVEVDGRAYTAVGQPPSPLDPPARGHRLAARWRLGWLRKALAGDEDQAPAAVALRKRTGQAAPEVWLNGSRVWARSVEGLPSLRFTNSADPAVRLDDMLRVLHAEVVEVREETEVSVFVALADSGPGSVRVVCAGVQVAEVEDLHDLPGVRAQVTAPVMDLDPCSMAPAEMGRWISLVREVWLQGLLLETVKPRPNLIDLEPRLKSCYPALGSLTGRDPLERRVLEHLRRKPLIPTVEGLWSLERCQAERPILAGEEFYVEKLLRQEGVDFGFADDLVEGRGVRLSERKRAVEVDFLQANLHARPVVLPFGWAEKPKGHVEIDLEARTATEVRGGERTTLSISRVETESEVQQGDLKEITWFWLLLGDGQRSFVYRDVEKEYYEKLDEPTGRSGVGWRLRELADRLRGSPAKP